MLHQTSRSLMPSRPDKLVLQDFSLCMAAGKVYALVGSSGCGKSTILSLVQRFYDPLAGRILINGHDVKELDLKFLRRNVAAMPQEPALFSGTIKDNLRVGNAEATDEEIIKAASAANADSFISQLPKSEVPSSQTRFLYIFAAVLRNEVAWFEKPENSVGFLAMHIVSDTSMIKTIISDRMSVIVQCISSILIATVVSMKVNWRMGLVAWALMPCHFIGGLIQAKSAKGFSGDSSMAHRQLVALASESVSNIRTVASFVYEEQLLKKAQFSLEEPRRLSRVQSIKYGVIQGVSLCLWNIAHAVALWYTTILVDKHQSSFEDGIRSYQIFSLTVPSITELWTLIPTVISAITILKPAFDILDRKTEIPPDVPETISSEGITGRIDFESISFRYPSRPEVVVLDNFNLSIETGAYVALVGPSGAGKSSVLALILRFYDPFKGRVLVDSKDIKEYNLHWLRRQIGLVQQEPLLFSSSIKDNIFYGSEGASETEVVEAAMEASIHDFICSLPNGYDTVVGEKGCQISGGQKQRIAIARTLLKRPVILLLDEATSALDAETERIIMQALGSSKWRRDKEASRRITRITVAHRLSTVVNSDTIVVMDNGRVVEMGDHSTLVANDNGIYSKLFQLQSQDT